MYFWTKHRFSARKMRQAYNVYDSSNVTDHIIKCDCIWTHSLIPLKSHWLVKCFSTALKIYDQLQLRSSLFHFQWFEWKTGHVFQYLIDDNRVFTVQRFFADLQLKFLERTGILEYHDLWKKNWPLKKIGCGNLLL